MIVVDTNVVASILLSDEGTDAARKLRLSDREWAVPAILPSELRNVLWKAIRRGRIAVADVYAAESAADALLRASVRPVQGARVLALAVASGCTAYDCEFVALAEALQVPLVTWDRALLVAFPARTVTPERYVAGV
jgi:predicted nucleic acid-binding protein